MLNVPAIREQARSHRSLIFAIGQQRPYLSALEPDQNIF
jgi:hypothetical protein